MILASFVPFAFAKSTKAEVASTFAPWLLLAKVGFSFFVYNFKVTSAKIEAKEKEGPRVQKGQDVLFTRLPKELVFFYLIKRGGSRKKMAKKIMPNVPTNKKV